MGFSYVLYDALNCGPRARHYRECFAHCRRHTYCILVRVSIGLLEYNNVYMDWGLYIPGVAAAVFFFYFFITVCKYYYRGITGSKVPKHKHIMITLEQQSSAV